MFVCLSVYVTDRIFTKRRFFTNSLLPGATAVNNKRNELKQKCSIKINIKEH